MDSKEKAMTKVKKAARRFFGSNPGTPTSNTPVPNIPPQSALHALADSALKTATNPAQKVSVPVPDNASVPSPQSAMKGEVALDVVEKGLVILDVASEWFGPLKAVTGVLGECIKTYKQVMDNKKDLDKLKNDLTEEVQDLQKQRKKYESSEMEQIFGDLLKELETVSNETVRRLQASNLQQAIQSVRISQEVEQFFKDVSKAYENCKFKVSLISARQTSEILKSLNFDKLKLSMKAFHDAQIGGGKERDSCTPGTRTQIIKDIEEWAERTTDGNMAHWIYGMAGTGKSTIARSVCLSLEKKQLLAATFFCSRQIPECNDCNYIIPTIAYQLAQYSPAFAEVLNKTIQEDPTIISKSASMQLDKLVVTCWDTVFKSQKLGPLTPVVVIDALDECRDISSVLEVLIPAIQKQELLGLKFLFTSRPEYYMHKYLKIDGPLSEGSNVDRMFLHDVEESLVQADIIRFLTCQFEHSELSVSEHNINKLANMSGKLFIFAATIVKFILEKHNPIMAEKRMNRVLDLKSKQEKHQTKGLDELYDTVLEHSFDFEKSLSEEKDTYLMILHAVITVQKPVSPSVISKMLGLQLQEVEEVIRELYSVLYIADSDQAIYTLHASFPDYIRTKGRAKGAFWCNEGLYHTILGKACFKNMMEELKFNICQLPSSFLADKDVPGISDKLRAIDETLRYSCRYWPYHFIWSDMTEEVIKQWKGCMEKKSLFWIEVMNLLGSIPEAYDGLQFLLEASDFFLDSKSSQTDFLQTMNNKENKTEIQAKIQAKIAELQQFLAFHAKSPGVERTPHLYLSSLPFWQKDFLGKQNLQNIINLKKCFQQSREMECWPTSSLEAVAISQDGKLIASGDWNGIITIWNVLRGKEVRRINGHSDHLWSVAFSPDGTKIVSGSDDKTVKIWDASTGAQIGEPLQGHSARVMSVAFSPDGTKIVSGSDDGTGRIWNVATGSQIGEPFQDHSNQVRSGGFSPDGTKIVFGSGHTVRIWDVTTGAEIGERLQGHSKQVMSVAFSPDGTKIVSGSYDQTVRIWDAATGAQIGEQLQGHTHQVNSVAFSPDGTHIVSGSNDETAIIWDMVTGSQIRELLQGHSNWVRSVAFSPDGTKIVSGSHDQTVRIWDAATGPHVSEPLQGHSNIVYSVTFSPDGTKIVSGSQDKTVRIWDAATGAQIREPLQGHTDEVNSVAFSPDGIHIVSGSDDQTVRIWDMATGSQIGEPLQGHTDRVWSVAFSPDGTKIVSGSADKTVRIWDAARASQIGEPLQGHRDWVRSVAFSPDGTKIVSGSNDNTVRIWNAVTGAQIGEPLLGHSDNVISVAFSPDGTKIVSGSSDWTVRIWNVATGAQIGESLQGHSDWVRSVAFSPDGTKIVSGSDDNTVRIWDAATGAQIGEPLQGHSHWVMSVAFSPDGGRIVSGSFDKTIRVWEVHADDNSLVAQTDINKLWTLDDDGWVHFPNISPGIVWIPPQFRPLLWRPQNTLIISRKGYTMIDLSKCIYGEDWTQCWPQD
ncbi:hypothetical protein D9758_006979 [Tetrapyrgos nigripes]|uniref:WD40 repeat-like protein n=1 Tax=Tetrapyrgos nigripes TaxID=182062 RepID=A0A8H5GSI0_9AGAR|nr:hypothetical protein D9758_006979 [Tetrapyrgos nigripes]